MFKIDLENHPYFTEVTRKAEMIGLIFDKVAKKITMEVEITHFLSDKAMTEYNKRFTLILNNGEQYPTGDVDADGNPVTAGDYDYFVMQAEAGAPLKALVESGVLQVQSTGLLNTKCNYKDQEVALP